MLEFKKTTEYNSTSFSATSDVLVCTRLTYGKAYRLIVTLDGTIGMLGQRVNQVVAMSDTDFVFYSDIQFASVEDLC
jgi:hypothetical protein